MGGQHRTAPPVTDYAAEDAALTVRTVESPAIGDPGRAASKVIPVPDRETAYRADTVVDGVVVTPAGGGRSVTLRGASVRGRSHRYYGKVRQDEFAYRAPDGSSWLVLAVADGVSAGEKSHEAAKIVTRSGCTHLGRLLASQHADSLDWSAVLNRLTEEIVRFGRDRLGLPETEKVAHHLAATAVFAVVDLSGDQDDVPVHAVSVGDSSAWLLRPETKQAWTPLHAVKNEGAIIASSATAALPSASLLRPTPVTTSIRAGEALVLMTDGVGDPLGAGTGEVGAYLAQAWARPPSPLSFAGQVDFARRSYDDDRTVLAIWPA
jgi:serine/threonine protein phosphatase PrpC